jgi:hypothetical protein
LRVRSEGWKSRLNEDTPIADKSAKVDAFAKLWRKHRWPTIVLMLVVLALIERSIYSNSMMTKRLDQLEKENSRLQSVLREAVQKNRGLTKLLDQLKAERASSRPLVSAVATVQVVTDSADQSAIPLLIGAGITPTNPHHSSWTVLAKLPWTLSRSGTRPTPAW